MVNERMYGLGAEPSAIRELFAYGMARKAEIGADSVFDLSLIHILSADEVAQLNALTEKLILSCKDKGINGKKKGRKAHSCHCC